MKNTLFPFLIFLLFLGSCNKTQVEDKTVQLQDSVQVPALNLTVVDSVKVQDSVSINEMLTLSFSSKVLTFPNITNKVLLDSIYSDAALSLPEYSEESLEKELKAKQLQYVNETKESMKDFSPEVAQVWEQNSDMKLLSTMKDFMTVQYTNSGYTGGAHGYYNETHKVFNVKTNKTLQLEDILRIKDRQVWNRILMENFLENDLEKGQSEMLLVKKIPLTSNFYFDKENLYFFYNQYEITAYAAGPVTIKIPYSEVKPFLNSEFRTALDL